MFKGEEFLVRLLRELTFKVGGLPGVLNEVEYGAAPIPCIVPADQGKRLHPLLRCGPLDTIGRIKPGHTGAKAADPLAAVLLADTAASSDRSCWIERSPFVRGAWPVILLARGASEEVIVLAAVLLADGSR